MRIRAARPEDVPAMLAVKTSLRFEQAEGDTRRGGFLLGSDAAGYLQRIAEGSTWVLDAGEGRLEGFAIVLPDAPFRASELWLRRDLVRWTEDIGLIEEQPLCYYDQLAVRRGSFALRRWGIALALTALLSVLDDHRHLVTATVSAPVVNLAAVPYLLRCKGRTIGRLDEHYPVIGALISDIWLVDREEIRARVAAPPGRGEAWVVDAAQRALGAFG